MKMKEGDSKESNMSGITTEQELASLRQQLKELAKKALRGRLDLCDLPSELNDDLEVTLAAVKSHPGIWYDLPDHWKGNVEVACAVFKSQARSYTRGRRVSWYDMPCHIKVVREVLDLALRARARLNWDDVPEELKSDEDLLATAYTYGKIFLDEVPIGLRRHNAAIALYSVQHDHIRADDCPCLTPDVLKQAVEDGRLAWGCLPMPLQTDITFALGLSKFPNHKIAQQILENVEGIRNHQVFWNNLVDTEPLHEKTVTMYMLLERFAPAELRVDRGFMEKACRKCPRSFTLIGMPLRTDSTFLEHLLTQNPAVLKFLPHAIQQECRRLVLKAASTIWVERKRDGKCFSDVNSEIWPGFWHEAEFAMSWAKAGLPLPHYRMPESVWVAWPNTDELCVQMALNDDCSTLKKLVPVIFSDVSFMKRVIDQKPELYIEARGMAREDPEIMTIAAASLPEFMKNYIFLLRTHGHDRKIDQYLEYLRQQLAPFRTFSSCILGNMLLDQSMKETGTNLTLLNQGLETSSRYKKLLTEYLGIPTGKWLLQLQEAEKNVLAAIKPWAPNA